jgi:thymidylate kinase
MRLAPTLRRLLGRVQLLAGEHQVQRRAQADEPRNDVRSGGVLRFSPPKGRYMKSEEPVAKHEFAYLDELAAILDARVVPGVIGIEGAAFAGKSTFAAVLAAETGATIIPEHTEFDPRAKALALSAWPDDSAAAFTRQRQFYLVERRRWEAVGKAVARGLRVILDRTALSVAAYSLARRASDTRSTGGFADIDLLREESGIGFPEILYLLRPPTAVLLERARWLAETGKPREIEPFLLLPSTLRLLNHYYDGVTSRLTRCIVVPKQPVADAPTTKEQA